MSRVLVLVAFVFSFAVGLLAQERPGYLSQFSPRDRTLIVLFDPLPHLEAILQDQDLRKAMSLQSDPGEMLASILNYAQFIPREIAIGFPNESQKSLDSSMRAFIYAIHTRGAYEAGEEPGEYLAGLTQALTQWQVPEVVVYLRMRDAGTAKMIRQMLRGNLGPRIVEGLEVVNEGREGFRASLRLGSLLKQQQLHLMLMEFGAEESSKEMWDHLSKLQVHLYVQQVGDGLRFALGGSPPAAPEGLELQELCEGFDGSGGTIMAAIWDISELKGSAPKWLEPWIRSKGTEIGDAVRELDDRGLEDSIASSVREIQVAGDTGAMRLWRDDALRADIREWGVKACDPLGDSSIVRPIPQDSSFWHVTSRDSLGDLIATRVGQAEDRLEGKIWQADLKDGAEQMDALETMAAFGYEQMQPVRELLVREAPNVFLPGAGCVFQPAGEIELMEISAEADGTEYRWAIQQWPVLRGALIGRPTSRDDAERFVDSVYRTLAEVIAEATDCEPPADAPLTRSIQLREGVEGRALELWIPHNQQGKPRITVDFAGDFQPHYFMLDDVMVISSSLELSRQMLDAWDGKGRQLPPVAQHPLIAAGEMKMNMLARILDSTYHLIERGELHADGQQVLPPPAVERGQSNAMVGLLEDAKWKVEQRAEQERHTSFELNISRR